MTKVFPNLKGYTNPYSADPNVTFKPPVPMIPNYAKPTMTQNNKPLPNQAQPNQKSSATNRDNQN